MAAFLATSAIIVKHKNYYVRIYKLQPGVFRIYGVAIHEEIGLVGLGLAAERRKTAATAEVARCPTPIGDAV